MKQNKTKVNSHKHTYTHPFIPKNLLVSDKNEFYFQSVKRTKQNK